MWNCGKNTPKNPVTYQKTFLFPKIASAVKLGIRVKKKKGNFLKSKNPSFYFFKYWTFCISVQKKIITVVANTYTNIFSYDLLPFPVPELGIINYKSHTAASKQPEGDTSPCTIHCSCGTEFATESNVTRPESSNSPKSQMATGWQHTAETKYFLVLFPPCYWLLLEIQYWAKWTPLVFSYSFSYFYVLM